MGFWTFLLGVPPVVAETGDEEHPVEGDDGASGAGAETGDADGLSDTGPAGSPNLEEADVSEPETAADGADETGDVVDGLDGSDAEADDLENIFTDDIAQPDEADDPEPMVLSGQTGDPEDEDSRLLDTLMAVGAEVDQAAEPDSEDPEPEPETEPQPQPQPSSADSSLLDLSSGHKNDEVRATLAAMGDDGSAARHVIHFAYAADGAVPQDEVLEQLGEQDFELVEAAEAGAIRMEHTREVASADFDAFTDLLEAELDAKGWQYDGWECAVAGA